MDLYLVDKNLVVYKDIIVMSYFNFSTILTDDEGKEYSGVNFNIPDFTVYKEFYKEYPITSSTEFRPDLIANDIYGDFTLSWVLDEINNIYHMSEYTKDKTINYLPYSILNTLGVL